MMLQFKQALLIDKKRYPLGLREVPADEVRHPHFQKFMKAGLVVQAGAGEGVKKKLSDLKTLPAPATEVAKQSMAAARAAQKVEPDATIGGDAEEADKPAKHSKKGK